MIRAAIFPGRYVQGPGALAQAGHFTAPLGKRALIVWDKVVEGIISERLFAGPVHPYTHALLEAVPKTDPGRKKERELPKGEPPSPIHPPSGCPFHPRCPLAEPSCAQTPQQLTEIAPGHRVACAVRTRRYAAVL